MALNIEKAREYLQSFDFKTLFIEELGWSNSKNKNAFPFEIKEDQFFRKAIAELSGATVYEITSKEGLIPDSKTRDAISREIQKITFEHILIFVDENESQTIWRWVKKQDKKNFSREHYFSKGQTGDLFIAKIAALMVDISEIENNITITDVAKKIQSALDVETVTKKFFRDYQDQFIAFVDFIDGIDDEADKRWYASVILNRLMFIYFLQKKMFLDGGNGNYLSDKLSHSKISLGANKFYNTFLEKLFFEGFAKPEMERNNITNQLIGKIKYLNGGLFLKHKIELKYKDQISISDEAFENLFVLFNNYSWSLDDTLGGTDNEINPDVLGYIFEKYINQKAFGAYYTRTEITDYLCEQTVYKLILDAVNEPEIDDEILKKAGLGRFPKSKSYNSIPELLISLDAATCKKLIVGDKATIPNLSLLDPACGSGAFLVAAMKTLINVYAAVLGKIDFLGDKKLTDWKNEILTKHPNINYYIKKQIITNNLYGVDVMEEATEIAKLRLFLALVASANKVDQLEPLPNIDFNIMNGNSLIGLNRVDENMFNTHYQPKTQSKVTGKVTQAANLFRAATIQTSIFSEGHSKNYQQLINEKEAAIISYKNAHELGISDLQTLRDSIQESEKQANEILNELLQEEFTALGIRYEEATWDEEKNSEGKSNKRKIDQSDINTLEPFHWGYEFSEIFRKKNGFDAIITNPPWDVFQTDEKEFFQTYDASIKKNIIRIEDWNEQFKQFMNNSDLRDKWLKHCSQFSYQSEYFKKSKQYKNLLSGKLNLYSLFVIQCFNLLNDKGYCGIITPSGIYSEANTSNLRKLLFEQSQINDVVGLSNEKFIFDGVDHRFKICLLTFQKGKVTENFLVNFKIDPREAISVNEIEFFLSNKAAFITMPLSFVKKQSPELNAIIEVKDEFNFSITNKLIAFPKLDAIELDTWSISLGSEFNMTSHSYLFKNDYEVGRLPLFEGKMIHQFTHQWQDTPTRYWINEQEGRKAILGRKEDTNQLLGYQTYRIAYRAIARTSDTRTIIGTVLPPNVFCGNSLLLTKGYLDKTHILIPVSFLNSFVLDFYLRQMVSSNINTFYIYQLPMPRLMAGDKWYRPIVERASKLICTTKEFANLWEKTNASKWSENIVAKDLITRNMLRAEIDGIIAHIYGLSEEEFSYILSTFPVVPIAQRQLTLQAFVSVQSNFLNTGKDEETLLALINKGESPLIEFKSTLRIDLKTNKPEKFIEHSAIKTLAAFLNSDGGTLIIGVEDDKNIIGLELDFNSFSKPDKLDEFQKHFDNLISKILGNRFHHYLKIDFPAIDGKTICVITIKEKSQEPVYVTNDAGQETFYIRRTASTIDLKPSEQAKYITDHWK